MTFPAMHQSASVVTPVARECVPPCAFNAASLAVHGGFSLMSLATHQTGVVEDDALNGGAHNQSSSASHASTSAALSVQRASSAATACAAHSLCSFTLSMEKILDYRLRVRVRVCR